MSTSHAIGSKQAQAALIEPFNEAEPAEETGLNSHFGSTMPKNPQPKQPTATTSAAPSSANSNNPFRDSLNNPTSPSSATKPGLRSSVRSQSGSPRERFPDFTNDSRRRAGSHGAPPSYHKSTASGGGSDQLQNRPRRGSSLKERYPGDRSHQPLDIIRRDSRKANRSHHLKKRSLNGADTIDRLDPALGGVAYHHEGPYDAASMARNHDRRYAPVAALRQSNNEALRATPRENVKDAVERHRPLEGTAVVPPGQPDRFGRTYNYEEGADLMREGNTDAGYKRWPGKDYHPDDLKGKSEPAFSLDRQLQNTSLNDHNTTADGIELDERANRKKDKDPVHLAGGEGPYVDAEMERYKHMDADAGGMKRNASLRAKGHDLKNKISGLRHRHGREDSR